MQSPLASTTKRAHGRALAASTGPSPSPSASPSPTRTPKPQPSQSGGVSGQFGLSVGDTLPWLPRAEMEHRLDDIRSLGVTWLRFDLDWSNIQHEGPGSWNWADYDAVISAARARGFQLLPILTYTPDWAHAAAGCEGPRCAPNPSQFANFAAAATARYAARGIHTWEIWNEPNDDGTWLPRADAAAYTQLLRATYPAIKRADPGATVITGGLASTDDADGVPQLTYLQSLYANGAKNYFDGVGYHPYSYPVPASYTASWNAWSKMSLTGTSFRSIMVANGDSAKPIWVTEYGAPTGGPNGLATTTNYNLEGNADHVTEAYQAAIATNVVQTARSYPWLAVTFWYSYKDEGTSTDTIENFFGLIRTDGSPKPAYSALKQALLSP